jgi:HNH endonuclease
MSDITVGRNSMPEQRPAIPAELERSLMIEAGYRCAMPMCNETSALTIDHIVEWAKVHKHEFSNMIVLCAVCHRRKTNTSDPRHINRASLKRIKSNLMMLNGRYSDLERPVIEDFQVQLAANPEVLPSVVIPEQLRLLIKYLIDDGFVAAGRDGSYTVGVKGVSHVYHHNLSLTLTERRCVSCRGSAFHFLSLRWRLPSLLPAIRRDWLRPP